MNNLFAKLHIQLQELTRDEQGQDLFEYALVISLIALVCIASLRPIATVVGNWFTTVSSSLA